MNIVNIKTDQLKPNDYNPNAMTNEDFAELVAEVKHLGRLPKPVVVRPNCIGFVIVDGEHGWRAACEAGLSEVPCEVAEIDDFEAMRQTYKRNQHGTHNPVKLGLMFKQMMLERDLSQRALAIEIAVSEGTIRNSLEYAKASEMRNDYAFEKLSIKQVRYCNRLPQIIGGLWLDSGADIKTLFKPLGVKTDDDLREAERQAYTEDTLGHYHNLEQTGLAAFLPPSNRKHVDFEKVFATLTEWDKLECAWTRGHWSREVLRQYTRHFYVGHRLLKTIHCMRDALSLLVDASVRPALFRLTPEEFTAALESGLTDGASSIDFKDYLKAVIAEKTGEIPKTIIERIAGGAQIKGISVSDRLMELEIEKEAPDYIQQSNLPLEAKYQLWKFEEHPMFRTIGDNLEAVKQAVAQKDRISQRDKEPLYRAVQRAIEETLREMVTQSKTEQLGEKALALRIAKRLPFYDAQEDAEAISTMAEKLSQLTKPELIALEQFTEDKRAWEKQAAAMRAMFKRT